MLFQSILIHEINERLIPIYVLGIFFILSEFCLEGQITMYTCMHTKLYIEYLVDS